MATRKRITLENWIHDAMLDVKDDKRKCSMIAVVHQKANGATQEVHSIKFATAKIWTASEVAEVLRTRADGFAQNLTGAQTFQLLAFYGQNEPEAFHPFVVHPAPDPNAVTPSEPATNEGQLAQRMRQHEAIFQQTYAQQRALNDASNNMLTMFSHMLMNMTAKYDAMFTATKELLMEQALNTHKYRMEEMQYERATGERKKWMGMAPMLVNTITGREVFPQSNADTVLVEQIAENLDENAVMALAQVLKPELLGPVMMRVEQVMKKKEAEKAALEAARTPPPGLSGEDDAAGGKVLGG